MAVGTAGLQLEIALELDHGAGEVSLGEVRVSEHAAHHAVIRVETGEHPELLDLFVIEGAVVQHPGQHMARIGVVWVGLDQRPILRDRVIHPVLEFGLRRPHISTLAVAQSSGGIYRAADLGQRFIPAPGGGVNPRQPVPRHREVGRQPDSLDKASFRVVVVPA